MIARKSRNTKYNFSKFEIGFVVLCFLYFSTWVILQKYNYAPDEYMRYLIPQYIYQHGTLPIGNDPEVVVSLFGSSYAYYPTFLGAIISALFMKATSFFTVNPIYLVIAARMTSVLAATITVFFTIKISKILFKSFYKYRWIFIIMVTMLPQFAFLSSYVNNDILAVCASSIIMYSWLFALNYGFNVKNCIVLAIGISICALSYQNTYAWILCSLIIFFSSYFVDNKKVNYKKMWKHLFLISGIVLLLISYFFIRNIILYGDLLGSKSFLSACEANAVDFLKPSLRNTPHNAGMSLWEMVTTTAYCDENWIVCNFKSFIGEFGYTQFALPDLLYYIVLSLLSFGIIGDLIFMFGKSKKHKICGKYVIFYICLLICIITPLILSLYYSYFIDYQPQGRYIFSIILPLMCFVSLGLSYMILKLKNTHIKNLIFYSICSTMIFVNMYAFLNVFIPSINH